MSKLSKPEYMAKVQLLTKEETERLLSRMSGKLPHRLERDKLTREEALAIQMELEDEQLQEWRKMMHALRKKEEEKKSGTKPKAEKKDKTSLTPKVKEKAVTATKTKAAEKAKATSKPKATKKTKILPKTNGRF